MHASRRPKCPNIQTLPTIVVETSGWDGSVNHDPNDVLIIDDLDNLDKEGEEGNAIPGNSENELEGQELMEDEEDEEWDLMTAKDQDILNDLCADAAKELKVFNILMAFRSNAEWKTAEAKRSLGYNGQAKCTRNLKKEKEWKAKKEKEALCTRCVSSLSAFFLFSSSLNSVTGQYMLQMFAPKAPSTSASTTPSPSMPHPPPPSPLPPSPPPAADVALPTIPIIVPVPTFNANQNDVDTLGYASDFDTDIKDFDESPSDVNEPAQKCCKLDVLYHVQRKKKHEHIVKEHALALAAIDKLLCAKREVGNTTPNSLQATRARAVQSCLCILSSSVRIMEASRISALAHGFLPKYGACLVRDWVWTWTANRELPTSSCGSHIKSFSVLDDPIILEGACIYLCKHNWVTDPQKFTCFINDELLPEAACKYAVGTIEPAMRRGLQQYLQVELFPRIHVKAAGGVSLKTSKRLMHKLGFGFVEHAKAVYFDGHEQPDIVQDHLERFIPEIDRLRNRLVKYVV